MTADPIKFLLVDDVEDNLLALEGLLRRDHLVLLKAGSGSEALELLRTHEVALAFLDVQMPGMDGFELAERMRGRERTKHVPIIFVTAEARDPLRMFKGYEHGAVDFLYKPIDPRMLKSKSDVFFELHRQRREYAEALRMNERFVGILSHDLRNPLAALLTGARLLEHELEDERHLRTVEHMTSAGLRMSAMIEQLLDLTRARLLDGIGLGGVRRRTDVTALARRAVEDLVAAHPTRAIVLRAPGECIVHVDPDRLLQLLSNLIGNAVDHGDASTRVTVDVACGAHGVSLSVHNGGAISPELLPTLFEPFGRRRHARASHRGLGLGLYISQQIALSHAGSIEVESSAETGTLMKLTIPRRVGLDEPGTDDARRTVLVVDDDLDTRESLQEVFERHGYRAVTAADGREALECLGDEERRPDVVVLDMMLPVLDGNRVCEVMRADPELSKIPVVASTADPEKVPPGVVVVPKPVRLETLLKTVAVLSGRRDV
jgi:CheY-like chemotaxis protein